MRDHETTDHGTTEDGRRKTGMRDHETTDHGTTEDGRRKTEDGICERKKPITPGLWSSSIVLRSFPGAMRSWLSPRR
jgi:hypothetical protein